MRILIFLTLLSVASLAVPTAAQEQSLQSEAWRLTTGDSSFYSSPDYDDSKWKTVTVHAPWETVFPNYDGFGWYRVKFTLSKTLATEDTLVLLLGKIDDLDETFLNGQRIGATGKISPPDSTRLSKWTEERAYFIPKRLWRETNTLAVRALDTGGGGGLYEGDLKLIPKKSFVVETFNPDVPHRSVKELPLITGSHVIIYNVKKQSFARAYTELFKAYSDSLSVKNLIKEIRLRLGVEDAESIQSMKQKVKSARQRIGKPTNFLDSMLYGSYTNDDGLNYGFGYGTFGNTTYPTLNFFLVDKKGYKFDRTESETVLSTRTEDANTFFDVSYSDKESEKVLRTKVEYLNRVRDLPHMSSHPSPPFITQQERDWVTHLRGDEDVRRETQLIDNTHAQLRLLSVAQVSSNKQILASLPPGEWNIAWVRDGSYAIAAAAHNRQDSIAKGGLEFFLTAQANRYKKFVWKDGIDYGVGKDYQISVCRYFGNGTEESDSNDSGPNIELDGFGLSLWAMQAYIEESGDTDFLQRHWTTCKEKIADVILHCIVRGKNSPFGVAGLIRKDSGIWERHLPGKQYTNTSVACFQGLKSAAWLAEKMSDKKLAKRYSEEAEKLRQSILKLCVDDEQVLKGNAGARDKKEYEYYDASVVEAINFGVLRLDNPQERAIAVATLKKFDDVLKMKTFTPNSPREGWARCSVEKESSSWYDEQEWVFLDLRIASAYTKLGDSASRARAKRILDWVTAQTAENFGLIAELYTVKEANYAGAYPMIGFGAGAYLLTLMDYYK